jgi:hypothetical protein
MSVSIELVVHRSLQTKRPPAVDRPSRCQSRPRVGCASVSRIDAKAPGHVSRPSIGDRGGLRLAFELRADRVVHDVADPAP